MFDQGKDSTTLAIDQLFFLATPNVRYVFSLQLADLLAAKERSAEIWRYVRSSENKLYLQK